MSFSNPPSIPTLPPAPAVYILMVSLPLLVLSESTSSLAAHVAFKIISSIAFVSGPLLVSTTWPPYHVLITSGLLFSLVGDICLIPSRDEYYPSSKGAATRRAPKEGDISTSFKLGVVAFAFAHIAYILAFLQDTLHVSWASLACTFVASIAAGKWLGAIYPAEKPSSSGNLLNLSISSEMRPLVAVYATIISFMLAVAAATTAPAFPSSWPRQRLLGAGMFVVSDLFVAHDAFNSSKLPIDADQTGIRRRSWPRYALGWGLYFGAQMTLAGTVYR